MSPASHPPDPTHGSAPGRPARHPEPFPAPWDPGGARDQDERAPVAGGADGVVAHPAVDAHGHHPAHGHDDPLLRRYGHPRVHSWITQRPTTFWGKVKQFVWGFLFFDWYHELQHSRSRYNDVMNLVLFGELLGIPLMNSSIGLRLLPYVLPDLNAWKHRQLEEHLVEEDAPHIH